MRARLCIDTGAFTDAGWLYEPRMTEISVVQVTDAVNPPSSSLSAVLSDDNVIEVLVAHCDGSKNITITFASI
jgi:hypothetical protein